MKPRLFYTVTDRGGALYCKARRITAVRIGAECTGAAAALLYSDLNIKDYSSP